MLEKTIVLIKIIKRFFLIKIIKAINQKKKIFKEIYYKLQKLLPENLLDKIYDFQLKKCTEKNRILYYYDKLVMPDNLITKII